MYPSIPISPIHLSSVFCIFLSMYPSIHPFITFFYLAVICHHSYLSSTTYLLSIFYLSSICHPSVYTSGLQPRGFCSSGGHLTMSGGIWGVTHAGGLSTDMWRVETRDRAPQPTVPSTRPPPQPPNYLTQSVNYAEGHCS